MPIGPGPEPVLEEPSVTGADADVAARAEPDPGAGRARHLRVVDAHRHRRRYRRRRARVLAVACAGLAVVFGLVYIHVVLAQRQFALDRLTTKVTQQENQYQQLRLKVAQLEAPSRIIATAEGKLGMVQPSSVTYLVQPGASKPGTGGGKASGTGAAPSGDANWPAIKSVMAGTP